MAKTKTSKIDRNLKRLERLVRILRLFVDTLVMLARLFI